MFLGFGRVVVGVMCWRAPRAILCADNQSIGKKRPPMGVEERVVYSMWRYTKAPIVMEHPAGIEPASSAWKAEILAIE